MRQASIELRVGNERFRTVTEQTDTWHSFSFGTHYDPDNTGFGRLIAHNEDRLVAGGGYDEHRHAGLEIVTWVLSGTLAHTDSAGHDGLVGPGRVQRLSSGSGVDHAERATADAPVHLVQMWLTPDTPDAAPSYQLGEVTPEALAADWVAVASGGRAEAAVRLDVDNVTLWVTRLPAGSSRPLPPGEHRHLFVARGAVSLSGAGALAAGDAARISGPGEWTLTGQRDTEVLVWESSR